MTEESEVQEVADSDSQPLTVREELTNALNDVKERQESEEPVKPKTEKAERPEKVEKEERTTIKEVEKPEGNTDQPAQKVAAAPNSWSAAAKAQWQTLPPELQKEISKREEEVHKGFTKMDEERNFGKQLKDVVTPYMPMITAEGGTPQKAIQDLLNTAYQLRTATPQEKGRILWQVAQQYGADMGASSPPARQADPYLQSLEQRQRAIEEQLQRERQTQQEHQQRLIQEQIDSFANDPANIHFEQVKAHMAALLKSELAKDMKDAYEQAVYANPEIRSTILEQQRADEELKRIAAIKSKTQAARIAASSVTGAPGGAIPAGKPKDLTLREELEAAMKQHAS